MKQITPLLILILTTVISAHAQYSGPEPKSPPRRAWIEFKGGDTVHGYVRSRSDSTLLFARKSAFLKDLRSVQTETRVISYHDIDVLHVHRPGSVWKGFGIGAASGAIIGAIIGALTWQQPAPSQDQWAIEIFDNQAESAIGGAIIGTASGMLVGALVGALSHKKFIIHGKKEKFMEAQRRARILP